MKIPDNRISFNYAYVHFLQKILSSNSLECLKKALYQYILKETFELRIKMISKNRYLDILLVKMVIGSKYIKFHSWKNV